MYRKDFKKDQSSYRTNDTNRVQMSQIPPLTTYRKVSKVQLNKEKAKSITDRLILDSEVNQAYKARKINQDYFIHFDYNSLSIEPETQKKSHVQERPKLVENYEEFLVDNLIIEPKTPIKKTNILDIFNNNSVRERTLSKQLDSTVLKEIQKYIKVPSLQKNMSKDERQNQKLIQRLEQQNEEQLDFMKIINMKDENFFDKNRQFKNIFHLVFGRDRQFKSNIDILDENNFSHDSVKDNSLKNYFPIFRDISRFARKCAKNMYIKEQKIDILLRNQINIDNNYTYHTIMGIASGRLNSEDIFNMMIEGNVFDLQGDNSSSFVSSQLEILYSDKTKNMMINYKSQNQDVKERKQFIQYPYNAAQNRRLEDLTRIYNEMRKKKDLIDNSITMTIMDKKVLSNFEHQKQLKIEQMIQYNTNSYRSKDQIIRKNKVHKTRDETIKVKALTKAFKMEKQHINMMKNTKKKKKTTQKTKIKQDKNI